MPNSFIEDGKVVGSAGIAVILEYAQVFNQMITLAISLCTFVYVANRAYRSLISQSKPKKKKGKRR